MYGAREMWEDLISKSAFKFYLLGSSVRPFLESYLLSRDSLAPAFQPSEPRHIVAVPEPEFPTCVN